jgi:hypothetical protein
MKPTTPGRSAMLGAMLLLPLVSAQAETWRVISMTVGDELMANAVSTFTDGIGDDSIVLSNRPDGAPVDAADVRVTVGFVDVSQSITDARPVSVDADAGTINLSSIYATGWRAERVCPVEQSNCPADQQRLVWIAVIGWDFGPVQALPFVKTLDGGMMTTWNAVASRVSQFDGFGNRRIQFTFAPAPPGTSDEFVTTDKNTVGNGQLSGIAAP